MQLLSNIIKTVFCRVQSVAYHTRTIKSIPKIHIMTNFNFAFWQETMILSVINAFLPKAASFINTEVGCSHYWARETCKVKSEKNTSNYYSLNPEKKKKNQNAQCTVAAIWWTTVSENENDVEMKVSGGKKLITVSTLSSNKKYLKKAHIRKSYSFSKTSFNFKIIKLPSSVKQLYELSNVEVSFWAIDRKIYSSSQIKENSRMLGVS